MYRRVVGAGGNMKYFIFCCERDSSGTTVAHEVREGDGADSPTQATKKASLCEAFFVREAARPKN
jgi:hypothetical protein